MAILYGLYFLINFYFFYKKQHPFVIDVLNFPNKAIPTLFDVFKSQHKLAKTIAFMRVYNFLKYKYSNVKITLSFSNLFQIFLISQFFGLSY